MNLIELGAGLGGAGALQLRDHGLLPDSRFDGPDAFHELVHEPEPGVGGGGGGDALLLAAEGGLGRQLEHCDKHDHCEGEQGCVLDQAVHYGQDDESGERGGEQLGDVGRRRSSR